MEHCIAFSGLSEDEVAAIGEHEHIPTIAASALADYLLRQPHGGEKIRAMIIDDIHNSLCGGRIKHAQECLWPFAIFSISIPKRVLEWKLSNPSFLLARPP